MPCACSARATTDTPSCMRKRIFSSGGLLVRSLAQITLVVGWKDIDDPFKSKSYDLYGMVADRFTQPDFDAVMDHGCFVGMGFSKCKLADGYEEPDLQNQPFHLENTLSYGQPFCLQCCSNSRDSNGFRQSWGLSCDYKTEQNVIDYDIFDKQFRFAARPTLTSLAITQCEIKRPRERQVINIIPTKGQRIDPSWTFHLGVKDLATGEWEESSKITANATGAKADEFVLKSSDILEDGSLPCDLGVDCPGDSIESKLENIFSTVTKRREGAAATLDTLDSATDGDPDAPVIRDDDWSEPDFSITALSGVKISRGASSPEGAFTWTVTWPWYQHDVPTMDVILYGANFTGATVNVSRIPNKYLHGYHLTLGVVEMSSGFDYWRAATNCHVQIIEGDEPPGRFTEIWTMEYANDATEVAISWLRLAAMLLVSIVATLISI